MTLPIPPQVPGVPYSVVPRWALPVTVGRTVLTGGAAGIVAVGWLAAVAVPSGLVPVTSTRTAAPTSAAASVYVPPVAPAMSTPSRCHWYVYALPFPLQVPCPAISVEARWAAPLSVGMTVFAGGAAVTLTVAVLVAVRVPSGLVTITSRRRCRPTSPTAMA